MDLGIDKRVALVCASSKGIGRAVAQCLAQEGARVALCARNEEVLSATCQAIKAETNAEVLGVPADLSRKEDIDRLVRTVSSELGSIEILVNNAGGPPPGGLMVLDDEAWQQALQLGLMSIVRLTRAVLPEMVERRWGRIVTIASNTVQQPREDLLLSSTVRAAVASLNKAIAAGLAQQNVLVHTVCPGPVGTDRMKQLALGIAKAKGISPAEAEQGLVNDVPMNRMATPEEIAALVACLVSERLSFMTGNTIAVDGGQLKGRF
jgi:3-oxoacyl-[acyl-carrier protein] reductase